MTTIKPASQLKLVVVKVGFNQMEAADLDRRRGHYGRAEFLRAAGLGASLMAALGAELATTWSESARIQSSFHHINKHAKDLNTIAQTAGPAAAARELQARSGQILSDFTEFRIVVFGGGEA